MIKFFRKIRQNLLSENKFNKYLIYAIGEIFLVVIGILIALQINNWNENRKVNALAKKYISDIKTDLINDTLTYKAVLDRLEITREKNKTLLNSSITKNISLDSLHSLISTSFHSIRIYKIDNTTYLKLSNTGFVDSGKFSEIFQDINTYYNKEYVAYSEYIEWDEELSVDISNPNFLGNHKSSVNLYNYQANEEASNNFREFINSNEFKNMSWANLSRKELVFDRLLFQKKIATELIEKIKNELNKE